MSLHTASVLIDVIRERTRQDERWGQQDHPPRPPLDAAASRRAAELKADYWKRENDYRAATGALAWDGILLEEVYEALSEVDNRKLREELVQAAAVCVAWVEHIDRTTL